jgi:hypothetical protein
MFPGMWKEWTCRLPPRQYLVAASEAFKDHAALRWDGLIPNDILILANVPDRHQQGDNRSPLFARDGRDAFELHDKRM